MQIGPEGEEDEESDMSNEVSHQNLEARESSNSNEEEADNNKESFI